MKHYVISEDEYRRLVAANEHPRAVMVLDDTVQAQTPDGVGRELFQIVGKVLKLAGSLGLSRVAGADIQVSREGAIRLPEFVVTDESVRDLLRKNASIERLRQTADLYFAKTTSTQIRSEEGLLAYQVGRTLRALCDNKVRLKAFSRQTLEEMVHLFGQKYYGISKVEITGLDRAVEILNEHKVPLVSRARAQRHFSKARFRSNMSDRAGLLVSKRGRHVEASAYDYIDIDKLDTTVPVEEYLDKIRASLADRRTEGETALTFVVLEQYRDRMISYLGLQYDARCHSWIRALPDGTFIALLAQIRTSNFTEGYAFWAQLDENRYPVKPPKEQKKSA